MKKINLLILYGVLTALHTGNSESRVIKEGQSAGYAYIYNTTDQNVAPGASVKFNSHGAMNTSISHTVGDSKITFNESGVYVVTFVTQGVSGDSFAIFVNDTVVQGSSYEPVVDINDYVNREVGQIILNLKAGDILTLNNYSPARLQGIAHLKAANALGKPSSVNASVIIHQID